MFTGSKQIFIGLEKRFTYSTNMFTKKLFPIQKHIFMYYQKIEGKIKWGNKKGKIRSKNKSEKNKRRNKKKKQK
jgi:hypothetical protein